MRATSPGVLPYSRMTTLRAGARAARRSRVGVAAQAPLRRSAARPAVGRRAAGLDDGRPHPRAGRQRDPSREAHGARQALGRPGARVEQPGGGRPARRRAAVHAARAICRRMPPEPSAASLAARLAVTAVAGDPLDRSDRERGLRQWSKAAGLDVPRDALTALADAGLDAQEVGELVTGMPDDEVASLLVRITMAWRARTLVDDIEKATGADCRTWSARSRSTPTAISRRRSPWTSAAASSARSTVFTPRLKHGVTIEREYADDLPSIQANAGELTQVWTNLIDNAHRRHARAGHAAGARPSRGRCDRRRGRRQRPRHPEGHPAADLRAVLHHQAAGRGHRPRPRHRPRHRSRGTRGPSACCTRSRAIRCCRCGCRSASRPPRRTPMAITCRHRDQDTHPAPRTNGCEECLASGDSWVHLRLCLDLRARRVLRFVEEQARDQALPRHAASARDLARARRGLGVVLRRRGILRRG